MKLTLYF